MINENGYVLDYADVPFKGATTLNELYTALVEIIEDIETQYAERKLGRVKRSFATTDKKSLADHNQATPVLIALNSYIEQLIAFWPSDYGKNDLLTIYNRSKRGKSLRNTPLNNLDTKIKNTYDMIEYLISKRQFELEIQRFYRYENNRMYVSPGEFISIKNGSVSEIVLEKVFKNTNKRVSEDSLIKLIANRLNYGNRASNEYLELPKRIDEACRYINKKVSSADKKYGTTQKLIYHEGGFVGVNKALLRETYMKKTN